MLTVQRGGGCCDLEECNELKAGLRCLKKYADNEVTEIRTGEQVACSHLGQSTVSVGSESDCMPTMNVTPLETCIRLLV